MESEAVLKWLLALVPLSISPGPANVLFAASGGAFGVKSTVPFLLGTNLVCIIQSLAVGAGLGALLFQFPAIAALLKYAGVAVLAYLAIRFFRSGVSNRTIAEPLGFKEGVVVELLNAKYLLIPVVMFSQFYNPSEDGVSGLIALTFSLATLTLVSNFIWVVGGSFLTTVLAREWVVKYQGFMFGGVLLVTAIWLGIG